MTRPGVPLGARAVPPARAPKPAPTPSDGNGNNGNNGNGDRPRPPGTDWPLVGRDAEITAARRALDGGRAGIVLAGGPGVGRTRLAREIAGYGERRDHPVRWLAATQAAAATPLGAFAHLLPPGRSYRDQVDLLDRAARALGVKAGGRRVVLVVDDAQLLDPASAALVHQLARAGLAFVVATLRTGAAAPDAITAFWKEGLAERLEVGELTPAQVDELAVAVLGGPVAVPAGQLLAAATQGNLLFLRELVRAGLDSGALAEAGGVWSWPGPIPVTARLCDVVEAALGPLTGEELAVLEVLALGEPLEAGVLEAWFPGEALHAVERRGLLRSDPDAGRMRLRLANPCYGLVLRERTPALRARAIRRKLVDALLATGARRAGDPVRIARWCLDSGRTAPAELLLRAARTALAGYDHELAERAARAARDNADALGAEPAPAAILLLAQALHLQGRCAEALTVLDTLPAEPGADPAARPTEAELAWAAAVRAQALCWGLGRPADAAAALATVAGQAREDAQRDLATAVRAAVLLVAGEVRPALTAASAVLRGPDLAEPAAVPAAVTATAALAVAGRPGVELVEAAGWAEAIARADGASRFPPGSMVPTRYLAIRLDGQLDEAAASAERAYRKSARRGDHWSAAAWAATLGRVALDGGRPVDARRWLAEALLLAERPRHASLLPACLAWLAEAEALLGNPAGAAAAVDRAADLRTPATALFDLEVTLAQGWLAAARGDLPAARAVARGAAATAERRGLLTVALWALHTAARFGGGGTVVAGLRRLAGAVAGPLAAACVAHAAAIAGHDGPGLDEAAAAFGATGARLLAAEAAAGAATVHSVRGRRSRSLSASAQARTYLESCQGAISPALVGLRAFGLTQREREVALLAAQGLSSRVIASQLAVSVRTVDNHLQVAYAKLGISGRRALPRALGAEG
jgi:DNA-binding NarL/FixJ family response regulator